MIPNLLATALLLALCVVIVRSLRAVRSSVARAVGRDALRLAAETGWWRGQRGSTWVRVDRAGERWDVRARHGICTSEALDVSTADAEALVGEWWGR